MANDPFASLRDELTRQWPGNRTINIVCHGHSVPAGYFRTPHVDTFNAYPHLWHQHIKARYPHAVVNVIVTAIGGENSESGAARFERDVLSLRPDLITIDYALNDRRLGLERAHAAWTSMITRAQSANIPLILLTPTGDTSADLRSSDDPLIQHAQQVRTLAKAHDVPLVDSLLAFQHYVAAGGALESLMSQANHPNRAGHDLVAAELAKFLG
jgi:lysophospholipase L1-like esterase